MFDIVRSLQLNVKRYFNGIRLDKETMKNKSLKNRNRHYFALKHIYFSTENLLHYTVYEIEKKKLTNVMNIFIETIQNLTFFYKLAFENMSKINVLCKFIIQYLHELNSQ